MEETVKTEEGISLLDLVKLLLSKIKLLILITLIGAIVGGAFGFVSTYGQDYYGTTIRFYVNPKRAESITENTSQYGVYGAYGKHVMDNMVKLLGSESFAEQLMLDENGLPKEGINDDIDAKRSLALQALEAVETARKDEAIAKENVTNATKEISEINEEVAAAQKDVNTTTSRANEARSVYLSYVEATGLADAEAKRLKEEWETASAERAAAEQALELKESNLKVARDALEEANEAVKTEQSKISEKLVVANEAIEETLEEWRKTEAYERQILAIQNAVSYSYLEKGEDLEDATDLARSFIRVDISVLQNQEFAEKLLELIKEVVPAYVRENMAVPSGYEGTNCIPTTRRHTITLLNPNYAMSQTVKFAVLLAAAAFVVACVAIILIDRSDKRLRDHEVITKMFDLPVLGIVPSIKTTNNAPAKENGTKENVAKEKEDK